jgi:hypothetical protein
MGKVFFENFPELKIFFLGRFLSVDVVGNHAMVCFSRREKAA